MQDFYAHPNWVELGDDVLVDQSLTVTRSSTKTRAHCPVARRSIERRSRSRSDRHAMSGADSISSLTMRGRCRSSCPRRIRSRRSAHHRKRASRRPRRTSPCSWRRSSLDRSPGSRGCTRQADTACLIRKSSS
ncbi:hypothetical protein [Sorangium sp. So ce375]|uniref:hypothetical protein n=1 Tax=Sorangium sp. So ce375 TaxID=3133306 RepID=UPI003F5B5B72